MAELTNRFKEAYVHDQCLPLIGVDKNDVQSYEEAKVSGLFAEVCPKFVGSVDQWVEEITSPFL